MNRKLFSLKNIAMVAVFSLVAFFGFNSFINKAEVKTSKPTGTTAWFAISVTAPASDPDNQTITTQTSTPS